MKTIYQKPETTATVLALEQLLQTASKPSAGIDNNDDNAVEAGAIESRRRSLWDEDEE